jgi:site-specific DNA recombinase
VRLVFTWYTVGDGEVGPLSIYAIAQKLNDMGVPTYADIHGRHKKRGSGKWCQSVVHKMQKNATYVGRWTYGKTRIVNGKWERNPDDHWLVVEVPAIVDLETWEAVQEQLLKNKQDARRNRKYEYLLSGRITCGTCGIKMVGHTVTRKSKEYMYYRCPAAHRRNAPYFQRCNAPLFPVDLVDSGTWAWVQELLTNPEALERGLRKHKAERDKENAPIHARLEVVDDLLSDNQRQLERLLDVYLSGDFPKEVLTDRKNRLEATILSLEKERGALAAQLEVGDLTEEQIKTLTDFVAKVGDGIDVANIDFETRRAVIDAMHVQATLFVKDEQKWVRVGCALRQERVYNLRSVSAMV